MGVPLGACRKSEEKLKCHLLLSTFFKTSSFYYFSFHKPGPQYSWNSPIDTFGLSVWSAGIRDIYDPAWLSMGVGI